MSWSLISTPHTIRSQRAIELAAQIARNGSKYRSNKIIWTSKEKEAMLNNAVIDIQICNGYI